MAVTKRAMSKTRKIFLYGSTTLAGLLAFLFTLTNYGISLEMNSTGVIKCAGNSLEPCYDYFNISLQEWHICGGNGFQIYTNDSEDVSIKLYKADRRYRADNPERWKHYSLAEGTCLKNGTKHEFRVEVAKPMDKTVKWGLRTGLINDADPIFLGYNVNDIIKEKQCNVGVVESWCKVTVTNPTSFSIPFNTSLLDKAVKVYAGRHDVDIEIKEIKTITTSINRTDYSYSYTYTDDKTPNGTDIKITTGQVATPIGWHWQNRTIIEEIDPSSKTLVPKSTVDLIIRAKYPVGNRIIGWTLSYNITNTKFTYG